MIVSKKNMYSILFWKTGIQNCAKLSASWLVLGLRKSVDALTMYCLHLHQTREDALNYFVDLRWVSCASEVCYFAHLISMVSPNLFSNLLFYLLSPLVQVFHPPSAVKLCSGVLFLLNPNICGQSEGFPSPLSYAPTQSITSKMPDNFVVIKIFGSAWNF